VKKNNLHQLIKENREKEEKEREVERVALEGVRW
jgi:hypothetical protein